MILIGIKSINTSTINTSTGDYSNVIHQQTDVLAQGTTEELTESYNKAVTKGKVSQKKYSELADTLEWSNISEKEYDKLATQYIKDIAILKYDKVLIIEGTVLK
jgi:hypothetical protein